MPYVVLRRWRPEDAEEVAPMGADPHVRAWSAIEDGVAAWLAREIAEEHGPTRAICAVGDDRVLGRVAVRRSGHASAALDFAALREHERPGGEISYWVLPEARGRGVARAGVAAMLDVLLRAGELRAVVLDIDLDNVASQRVAVSLGAQRRHPGRPVVDRLGATHTMAVWVISLSDA